jgi:hypothetical protein
MRDLIGKKRINIGPLTGPTGPHGGANREFRGGAKDIPGATRGCFLEGTGAARQASAKSHWAAILSGRKKSEPEMAPLLPANLKEKCTFVA